METTLLLSQVEGLAKENGYEPAVLNAVLRVESSGHGFSPITGKLIIQFEPSWFKREYADWKRYSDNSTWINNGIGSQTIEWRAFDGAFAINADAAMESTSIGLMQIMGFHWKELGFKSVGEMWDYAKESEANQLDLGIRFIKSIPALDKALKEKDWKTFAYYYNGSNYQRFNYDTRLEQAYNSSITMFS